MIFKEKKIALKNGKTAILKSPQTEDAEKLLNYAIKISGETDYLLRYPEEWKNSLKDEENWINALLSSCNGLAITCFVDGEIAGNCNISFGDRIKTAHRATIGMGILKDYWNLGIGTAMLAELIAVARERGTEIMELEFIEGNERAKRLYEKFGFQTVSEKPKAIKLKDGTYLKDFYMQKYLKE